MSTTDIRSHVLGLPRMGAHRELKKVLESYWKGTGSRDALVSTAAEIRATNRKLQRDAGLHFVTVGDFAYYDLMLNMSIMFGNIPERFAVAQDQEIDLDDMFRMARGRAPSGTPQAACEMTKWFDTNYHYIVPEFTANTNFRLASDWLFNEVQEAQAEGGNVKPVLIGPLTYLYLGKAQGDLDRMSLLPQLLKVYSEVLGKLKAMGIASVQIDEPILSLDLPASVRAQFAQAYASLADSGLEILLANYFGYFGDNLETALALPVQALHVDMIRGGQELDSIVKKLPANMALSAGVVEGRNIWRNNLSDSLSALKQLHSSLGDRLIVASACSLLHSPYDLNNEHKLDADLKSWLAFAVQKCQEVGVLAQALTNADSSDVVSAFQASDLAAQSRKTSSKIHNPAVQQAVAGISADMCKRKSSYQVRAEAQKVSLGMPLFPTTTIGSFPQTQEIRRTRRLFKAGEVQESQYNQSMQDEIRDVVKRQSELGLDMLVHGEPERNDMVEYFGEQLSGFGFTSNGWVQSYGSRCVKPPVIFGDVSRPNPMTVDWSSFAQSLTDKPMKGMLTGAITILCWSFERDDLSREAICRQVALALRDEVNDLEKAGIKAIQIDEPAIREGMPLRESDFADYFRWAVESFHITADGVEDDTQIHTHMCYSEFNDMIDSVAALDADVVSIEASRSNMELLDAFESYQYPNDIGPGVYDIHSPNVPEQERMVRSLKLAAQKIPKERLWVNPDCGLKTRDWEETTSSLQAMVAAAKQLREELA